MSSSNWSVVPDYDCHHFVSSIVVFVSYTLASVIFLLPPYILVVYVGVRRQRAMSHSDVLTFHMAAVEMCGVLGSLLYTLSLPLQSDALLALGVFVYAVTFPGQTLLHVLACAERYLAVVHAVAYARLRGRGARIRNASAACVWLACILWLAVTVRYFPAFPTVPLLVLLAVCMLLSCFCSLAVLRVLIGPQPGGGAGRSRRRALHMVGAISALLALRFVGLFTCFGLEHVLSAEAKCVVMDAGLWLSVPSSLLLPLLFLRRAGMLRRRNNDTAADRVQNRGG